MTRDQFISLLNSPDTLNLKMVEDLEEITRQYPYFQNAHLLLAKQYHGHQNIKYENYLKKAAAYAPDREVLYNLIHHPVTSEIHLDPPDIQVSQNEAYMPKADDEISSEIKKEELEFSSTDSISDEIPNSLDTDSQTSADNQDGVKTELDDLIKQRLAEISAIPPQDNNEEIPVIDQPDQESNIRLEEKTDEIQKTIEETPELSLGIDSINSSDESVSTSGENKTEAPIEVSKEPLNSDKNEKHTFLDWLKVRSIPVIPNEDIGERFGTIEEINKSDIKDPEGSSPTLVDKFIKNEPRIVPARSEFYSPVNMARKSIQQNSDLVSETLATIYANQGNIDKAIDTYKVLSLKFPEKSSYFAALIENLESTRNDEE